MNATLDPELGAKCPIPACDVRLPADRIMCSTHWQLAPVAARARIFTTFREYEAACAGGVGAEMNAAAERHRQARDAARLAVCERMGLHPDQE